MKLNSKILSLFCFLQCAPFSFYPLTTEYQETCTQTGTRAYTCVLMRACAHTHARTLASYQTVGMYLLSHACFKSLTKK